MTVDVSTLTGEVASSRAKRKRGRRTTRKWLTHLGLAVLAVVLGIVVWDLVSRNFSAYFLPSPLLTLQGALGLIADGTLWSSITASLGRILSGWGLGVAVGIPAGLLMGCVPWLRQMLDPYVQFFRFVPPIAFVTLAIIWLGPGETSKIALIFYTSIFIVALSTLAGVMAVDELKIRAARALGASSARTLVSVVLPSTVPFAVTGARLAMGNSFMTIISAEIVSAQSGLGALIWTSRNYAKTEWVFVGIITLGVLGFVLDWILRFVAAKTLRRYGVNF